MASLSLSSALVLLLVTMAFVVDVSYAGGEGSLTQAQCPAACNYRCSATSHKSACLMYCNKCCKKCLCVPSGTYGNKEECPCYNNWKTQEGGPKCP